MGQMGLVFDRMFGCFKRLDFFLPRQRTPSEFRTESEMEPPPHNITGSADQTLLAHSNLSSADNWQGLMDAKERRKRQNRINQRSHRETRKRTQLGNGQSTRPTRPSSLRSFPQTNQPESLALMEQPLNAPQQGSNEPSSELDSLDTATGSLFCYRPSPSDHPPSSCPDRSSSSVMTTLWFNMPCNLKRTALIELLATFYNSYTMNCPMSSHLLTVTKMNVHRAFVCNMLSLGITWEWMEEDSTSPLNVVGPNKDLGLLPNSLLPTSLQRSSVHHTWIDLFPCPRMRDNLLRAGNEWDDEELCTDIMGFWDNNGADSHGLIVWGEPSNPQNWEVQPGFLKKWGWILRGCDEIIKSTNQWRAKRGERPLFSASFLISS